MKNKFILPLLLLLSLFAQGQTASNYNLGYCVRYEKGHLFTHKDSDLNVIDYNIEWPEVVGFDSATSLRRFISGMLVDTSTTNIDTLLNTFNETYGVPVTEMFKTIPDDRRFCYITDKATIQAYKPNQWIAYLVESNAEPQSLSSVHPKREERVVVYDINKQRVLLADDIVRKSVITLNESQELYDMLFSPLSDDIYNNMQQCEIIGVWVENDKICFLMNCVSAGRQLYFQSYLPLEQYSYILTRDGRNLFTKEKTIKTQLITPSQTWNGDTIYNNVSTMPQFKGGHDSMREYFSHVSRPNATITKPISVYTSFIVDKEGKIQDVSVVKPISPELDRHAASVIKGMPPFTPGEQDGKKVCVRLYMPVNYR